MSSNIIHQYFKKELEGMKILVKLNPILWSGQELTVDSLGVVSSRELAFNEHALDRLSVDGFVEVSAMEFNLYLCGLVQ